MKLVRFSTNGQSPRLGVLQGDRIADLQASVAATLTRRGVVGAGGRAPPRGAAPPPRLGANPDGGCWVRASLIIARPNERDHGLRRDMPPTRRGVWTSRRRPVG